MIVLSLCDRTGNMVKPWAEAGYRCICVDTQHPQGVTKNPEGVEFVRADVLEYLPPRGEFAAVFAFPPCTHLAASGARWFGDKGLSALRDSISLVEACRRICEWSGAPYCIENPIGTLSTYWRKPDYIFDPCDYGAYLTPPSDAYTKKTCLWTGGGFVMPEKRPVAPTEGSRMHKLPPSEDRANLRSVTPQGFAQAIFEANASRTEPFMNPACKLSYAALVALVGETEAANIYSEAFPTNPGDLVAMTHICQERSE